MKTFFAKPFGCGLVALGAIALPFLAAWPLAAAPLFQEARVSEVIRDVRLLEAHGAPRPAVVNDKVTLERAVRTGVESRAELTFTDLTITRLGANTIFALRSGAREVDLTSGTILLEVPSGKAPVKASTGSITVAVSGGTALLGTGPPIKFMVLEGIGTMYPKDHPEKAVSLKGGEMVTATADGKISQPAQFDVKLVLATSHLILDFPPLANLPLILAVVNQQLAAQQLAGTTSQSLAKNLVDVINVTSQSATANPVVVAATTSTPIPTPTPSKFGPPSIITSPVPYVITRRTVIKTDPSITTHGVTDFGTIYRGPTDDGAFTLWAFGSTSAFDTALKIDTEFFADPNNLPIAVFKFQSLSLIGNPTIDLSNGGATKLGLIGVDGITSGPPGGTLTFTGLDTVFLATVNGPINLTADVSFENLSVLAIYARGAGSDLTVDSPISNIGALKLGAEGSIQLSNPSTMTVGSFDTTSGDDQTLSISGSLLLNGEVNFKTLVLPGTTLASGANLTLNVMGDYMNSSTTDASQLRVINEGAHIGTGGNVSVDITGNLTAAGLGSATGFPEPGDVELLVQNTNARIDTGGNISLTVGGNVNVNGLAVYLQNYDETANPAGSIGTGGNIDVEVTGNLTTHSYVDVFLNNRGGGMIGSGGNLTFNVSGALTIGADAGGGGLVGFSSEFIISTRYDDVGGNTTPSSIGSSVALNLHAGSINMAGDLFGSGISNRGGSTINGNATATWDVTGNLVIQGTGNSSAAGGGFGDSWFILNDTLNPSIDPGAHLADPPGGTIKGNATLALSVGGNVNIAGDASFEIANHRVAASTASRGGIINGDAAINISAGNFSVGGELDVDIFNQKGGAATGSGGSILGSAAISLTVAGNLALPATDANSAGVAGDLSFLIQNHRAGSAGTAGSIGNNASITLQSGSIGSTTTPAGNLDFEINNFNGGNIGGSATVQIGTTGDVHAKSLTALINNSGGGSIGGKAAITVGVSNDLNTSGEANFFITNSAVGHIIGDATIGVADSNGINAGNGAFFAIINDDSGEGTFGGTISGNALVHVTADRLSTEELAASAFNLFGTIHNSGGHIDGNATVMFDITGAITTQGTASFDILNFNDGGINGGGVINGNAMVTLNAGALSIGSGDLFVKIINNGGVIAGNATLNMNVGGTATVAQDATVQILGNDPTGDGSVAAINFNGGSYQVGGTFLTSIDEDGTITFANTDIHANVVKAGVFGPNGSLIIGGSGSNTISANTLLQLYAPGSNGLLKFIANVTLSSGTAMDLAANTITINNGVIVTIAGAGGAANIYATNANYTGFGGNGSTTGTFAGAGANSPQPVSSAPPFDPPPLATVSKVTSGKTTGAAIDVSSTGELLSLLDGAPVGPDGKITISGSHSINNLKNLGGTNINGLSRADRRMLIQQLRDERRDTAPVGGKRILSL